jgi:uncharacterized protein (UPF0335 family)
MRDDSYKKFQEQMFDQLRDLEQLNTAAEIDAAWEQVVQGWANAGLSAKQVRRIVKLNKIQDPLRSKIQDLIHSKLP